MNAAQTHCKKCGGTGHLPVFSHSDGGRCWACQGKADTSYTRTLEAMTDDQHEAIRLAAAADRKAARLARRAAR